MQESLQWIVLGSLYALILSCNFSYNPCGRYWFIAQIPTSVLKLYFPQLLEGWKITALSWVLLWELPSCKEINLTQAHIPSLGKAHIQCFFSVGMRRASRLASKWDNFEGPIIPALELPWFLLWLYCISMPPSAQFYRCWSLRAFLNKLPAQNLHLRVCFL